MNLEAIGTAAVLGALVLLSMCVMLYVASYESAAVRKHLRWLLYSFGLVPGLVGVLVAFWFFVTRSVEVAYIFAFLSALFIGTLKSPTST